MSAASVPVAGARPALPSRPPPPLGLTATASVAALLVLLPIAYTAVEAAGVSLPEAAALLFRPLVGELLFNTVSLVLAATAAAAIVATTAAWFVERTRIPGQAAWAVLVVVPLAIPPFVTSYAWISLDPALQGFAGALVVVTCSYYPLIYLPVAAALRSMDPALEETARSLGHGPWRCFFRVVLPQLRPALLGGMLLVALDTLVEFGAFALLRFRTFTTEIYAEYRIGFGGPSASLLALVLVLLCLLCLAGEVAVRGRSRYARIGRGTRRRAMRYQLDWRRWPILAGFVLLTLLTLGMPSSMIIYWLTQHASEAISPAAVTAARLLSATASSIGLGLAGAGLTMLLALPLGFLSVRYEGRLATLLERTAYLAQGVPGIVVALALVSLTAQVLQPLYQSAALLVTAYAIVFLPLALVNVRAALLQTPRGLEEAGRSLGLGWAGVAWRITLPLAGPGLGAGAAMVFVSVVTELTATLLLAPIGTRTLATQVWANSSALAYAAAAPYAALMVGISLMSAWLLARRFGAVGALATS